MTVNEVQAGPRAGPLAIVVDLAAAGNLWEFYTYLVLAQGKKSGIVGLGEVLFLQSIQKYTEPLLELRVSLQHWLFSSLAFA